MQHLFTFLAPRNLNLKTLELFFSLNQRLSIWSFGRRVFALTKAVQYIIAQLSCADCEQAGIRLVQIRIKRTTND